MSRLHHNVIHALAEVAFRRQFTHTMVLAATVQRRQAIFVRRVPYEDKATSEQGRTPSGDPEGDRCDLY